MLRALRHPDFGRLAANAQNQAGRMLNVGWDGGYCYWSPELVGSLEIGNLHAGGLDRAAHAAVQRAIDAGIARCRRDCAHFDFCLGGAPANKLAEHGSFAAAETMACRLSQKVLIDAVLEALDADLPHAA